MLRQEIINDLQIALEKLGMAAVEPNLEHPAEEARGDYSTNCAMVALKKNSPRPSLAKRGSHLPSPGRRGKGEVMGIKSPLDLAQTIVANFPKTDYLEKIEAVAPGFINFWLKPDYLYNSIVREILKQGEAYGQTDLLKGKKIMVEFAHPNTHKMFHIGHLRNITTGEAVVRILEANGAEVIRANYQGDVGLHIAKALWGILQKTKKNVCHPRESLACRQAGGDPEQIPEMNSGQALKQVQDDKRVEFLGEAYVVGSKAFEEDEKANKKIGEINKKIYQKDPEVIKLWQETRAWSLDYFDRIYKRVDTTFDRLYFESECSEAGSKLASQRVSLQKKILEKSEGAIIFDGKPYGLDTRVFVNSQGFPTYEAKELALAKLEFSEFGKLDKLIHVVGPEQASFFKVTFKVEELLGIQKGEQCHLIYGWVKLKKGKMSSRTGDVVLGEWLLDEVKKRLQEKFKMEEETAEVVAVGAVKYSLLKVRLSSEISFDIEESINLEGDSGPYLQYAYARTRSVLAKAKDLKLDTGNWKLDKQSFSTNREVRSSKLDDQTSSIQSRNLASSVQRLASEELSLLRSLYRFPEIVVSAGIKYSPNLLCGYLFDLAQKYNLFYNKLSILNPENSPQPSLAKRGSSSSFMEEESSPSPEGKGQGEVREFRLVLTQATGQVLKNGLYLLGIKVVEKM